MECLNCQAKLSPGSKFCIECGKPVPIACPACGLGNPSHAKFCANCGTRLIGVSPSLADISPQRQSPSSSLPSAGSSR